MGHKNRFQKHHSRKYRKPKILKSSTQDTDLSNHQSLLNDAVSEDASIQETIKPVLKQNQAVKLQQKPTIASFSFQDSVKDLRNALYLSAAFVVFLVLAYIVKLKTPIFSTGVNYLYKIFHF